MVGAGPVVAWYDEDVYCLAICLPICCLMLLAPRGLRPLLAQEPSLEVRVLPGDKFVGLNGGFLKCPWRSIKKLVGLDRGFAAWSG